MTESLAGVWLSRVRLLLISVQALALASAVGAGGRPWLGAAWLAVAAGAEAARHLRADPPTPHVALDLALLTAMAATWGDTHEPLQAILLLEVALVALFLPRRAAWTLGGGGIVAFGAALVGSGWAAGEPALHVLAHGLVLGLAAFGLLAFLSAAAEQARRAQLEAEHARRLAAVGRVAAGVAHELSTPLGSLLLLTEEVLAELPAGSPARAPAEVILTQVARARGIVDRLLGGRAGAETTARAGSSVRSWVEEWRRARGAEVQVDIADGVEVAVRGDADAWRGAVWTLLDNAATAGGSLGVRAEPAPEGVLVRVRDGGHGIPAEVLERLGEPFVTAWPGGGGVGLGTYVARTYARETGGDLRWANVDGGGAEARLTLPWAR